LEIDWNIYQATEKRKNEIGQGKTVEIGELQMD
jgi:hypothetical protein